MKFTINKPRKSFKSDDEYLAQIYRDNPIIADTGVPLERFKAQIGAYKTVYGTSIRGAVNKYAGSTAFTPYTERATDNLIQGLKEFGQFKALTTSIRDARGHFTKFDRSQLHWERDYGAYVYAGKVLIDVSNSPERITLSYL